MAVLVTGGAGYIGSHAVRRLIAQGERVVVLDNLSTGFAKAVHPGAELVVGDLLDGAGLDTLFKVHDIDAVMHFAALSVVPESMLKPREYYENNVGGTMSLLGAMTKAGVKRMVFSSSASTYGNSGDAMITEDTPQNPESVYGTTKLIIEKMLKDYESAYGIRHVAMRYFNVAGADESGEIGEAHCPETHLIPIILQTLLGKRDVFNICGVDYPTPDGTCIRDYVYVYDLVDAHILALAALREGRPSTAYNLGNGSGFSVREVLKTAEQVTGQTVSSREEARRDGDPAMLVASSAKIGRELNWRPAHAGLDQIIATAWKWHSAHPDGYGNGAD